MDLGLKGKVALVSAGSKGLGYGVARALAADGARVSICSRDVANVEAAVARLREETGADVIGMACDVTKPEHIAAWVAASAAWGRGFSRAPGAQTPTPRAEGWAR